MDSITIDIEKIKNFPKYHLTILTEVITDLSRIYQEERGIMYSDIINLIIRKEYKGKVYNLLLLWCNYKIRCGETILNPHEFL